ncbi:WD40 repeat-like protein [Imleria badia]|nr:WD40 repeat-like protein [Imleria badia]
MPAVTPPRPDDGGTPPQLVILAHDGIIRALAYLPDGRRIVTGSVEGTVKVWNLENGEQEGTPMEHDQEVISVAVTRDGTKIISTDADPDIDEYWGIRMWDVESHELVREWTRDSEGNCPNVAISPDDRLIAVGQWDVGIYTMQGRLVNDIKVDKEVWSMSFSPDGKELACGCGHWDNIHVYDVYTGALVLDFFLPRTTKQFAAGTPTQEKKLVNHGRIKQTAYTPSPFHQMDQFSLARPEIKLFASGMRLLAIPSYNIYNTMNLLTLFVSLPPVNAWYQQVAIQRYICGGYLGWIPSSARQAMPLASSWHATPCTVRNLPSSTHLRRPVTVYTFPLPSKCRVAILVYIIQINASHPPRFSIYTQPLPYDTQNQPLLERQPYLMKRTWSTSSHTPPSALMSANAYSNYSYVKCTGNLLQLDLATSTGLRVPGDLIPSKSSLPVGIQNTPWTGLASIANGDCNSMHASQIESHSTSNGDPKKIRKIDEIKKKLVEMLREIGFKLSNGRLPWSTLERDLRKKGYVIANWPHGVDRDRDKGVSGLSAGDADKLHGALFVDDCQIQFVRCKEYASDNDGVTSLAVASSSSGGPREINHSSTGRALPRFRVTTAEEYPNKRRLCTMRLPLLSHGGWIKKDGERDKQPGLLRLQARESGLGLNMVVRIRKAVNVFEMPKDMTVGKVLRTEELVTNCQSTIMSSIASSQRSNRDPPQPQRVILVPDGNVWMLAYHPDGRRVVSRSDDGTIRVWNLDNGEQEGSSMKYESFVVDNLAVTSDGTRIVGSDETGSIKIWDVESHEIVQEWTHQGSYPELSISPDDQLIAVGNWVVTIYTMEGRQVNHSIQVGTTVFSMGFSPRGDKLACGTRYEVYVYDVNSGTLILVLQGHQDRVHRVLWSRDGSRLFSASNDKTICCWDSDTGEQIGRPWTGHTDRVCYISLSPDGSKLASASNDRTVRFWDTISGQLIPQHLEHRYGVNAACFSPSGEFVASATGNGRIHLWRVPWLDAVESQASTAPNIIMPDLQSILPDLSLTLDERQRMFELRLRKLLDLASSKGFYISRDLFPPSLPMGTRNIPLTGIERIADGDSDAMSASPMEPSTSVLHSKSNGNAKETRKVDKNERKFVDMLRAPVDGYMIIRCGNNAGVAPLAAARDQIDPARSNHSTAGDQQRCKVITTEAHSAPAPSQDALLATN